MLILKFLPSVYDILTYPNSLQGEKLKKAKKLDDQMNIDKYRIAANTITLFQNKSKINIENKHVLNYTNWRKDFLFPIIEFLRYLHST